MFSKFVQIYRIPFLASITLAIVLIALKAERHPVLITLTILGCLLGTFALDLDYIIHAYFMEPSKEFSKNLRAYLKHMDIINALDYVNYHRDEVKDKTLNSGLFQMVLAGACIFVMFSTTYVFVKALVLSVLLNSLYRLGEYYFKNKPEEWFWNIDIKTHKKSMILYAVVISAILVFSIGFF